MTLVTAVASGRAKTERSAAFDAGAGCRNRDGVPYAVPLADRGWSCAARWRGRHLGRGVVSIAPRRPRVGALRLAVGLGGRCRGRPATRLYRRRHRRFGDRPQARHRLHRETSSRNRRLSAPVDVNCSRSAQPTREHQSGARPCSATKNSRATCVRTRARSAAATEASTGSPIAALRAAIRLATSTRNGVASSMILNGAPTA